MLRASLLSGLAISILLLVGCGSGEPETPALPTPVPTYDAARFFAVPEAIAAAPTAVPAAAPSPPQDGARDQPADASASSPDAAETEIEPSTGAETEADEEATARPADEETSVPADAVDAEEEGGADVDNSAIEAAVPAPTAAEPRPTEETAAVVDTEDADSPLAVETAAQDAAMTATLPATTTAVVDVEAEVPAQPQDSDGEDLAHDGRYADLPDAIAALMAAADPANGEQLTLQNACIGCHNMDPEMAMAGPTWADLADTAATRVEGQSAALYLYNSIVNPNDHIVDGYMPNIMLQTYGETLSEQDQADLIAYLLTLTGE